MIRGLVFSWEAWVIWYASVAFWYTFTGGKKTEDDQSVLRIPVTPVTPEAKSEPSKPAPTLISMNYEGPDNVHDIRSRPSKPDWMK